MGNKEKNKEKILILFSGAHLAYSPTVIQLYDELAKVADVTILAEIIPSFIPQKLTKRNIIYFEEQPWKKPSFKKKIGYFFLRRFNKPAKRLEAAGLRLKMSYDHFNRVQTTIKKGKYDRVIALDLQNLFYCSVMDLHADFLSLELGTGEQFIPYINKNIIDCVLIQSRERLDYLFKDIHAPVFIIPNSPVYQPHTYTGKKEGLLFGGTAWDPFGFFHCLDYVKAYPEVPLTVQGAVPSSEKERIQNDYADLLQKKLLIINDSYLKNEEVVNYFARFEIGFCFYNFDIEWIRHFNYKSAPSGKIYKYLAAGVPVLAIDIPGFKFIEEKKCGVLIEDLSVKSIRAGIEKIRSNYDMYAQNTIKAAEYFSFDKAVQPYLENVKNTP